MVAQKRCKMNDPKISPSDMPIFMVTLIHNELRMLTAKKERQRKWRLRMSGT